MEEKNIGVAKPIIFSILGVVVLILGFLYFIDKVSDKVLEVEKPVEKVKTTKTYNTNVSAGLYK